MTSSLLAAVAASLVAGCALLFGPADRRDKSLPHAALVAAVFVVIFSLQALTMRTFYDGAQGDNRYQLAIVHQVQDGNLLGDYFYRGVPAHYPPLYFWIVGGLGELLGLEPEATLRWMPVLTIVLAAAAVAWLARRIGASPAVAFVLCFAIGGFATYYLFSYTPDRGLWMVLIEKPQQLLGALLCLSVPVATAGLLRRPLVLFSSIALLTAALALTMPIFLPIAFVAALFVAAFVGGPRERAASLVALGAAMGAAALIASPYLVPVLTELATRRSAGGYLYWQSLPVLDISHWTVGFGFGIPLVFGVLSSKAILGQETESTRRAASALVSATVPAWLVYLSAFVTYPLFGWSLFSWWATIPALLGTCLIAAWGITNRAREYVYAGRAGRRFSREATLRASTALVVAAFALSWTARTDDFLTYSQSPIDPDYRRAAQLLEQATSKESSFVAGQEEVLVSALSGRGLVYVAHSFYNSPLADSAQRKEAVIDLLHRPSCAKVSQLQIAYGMEAVALNPAARWIPRLQQTSNSIALEEGVPALEEGDLVFSDLVALRRGDPERVSKTILYRASPALEHLPCLERVMDTPGLVLFVVRPGSGVQ